MWRYLIVLLFIFATGQCARGADEFVPVDLQPFANQKLTEGFGNGLETNNLSSLPAGDQKFDGCKFRIGEKLIQLGSTVVKDPPESVPGIQVGRKTGKLHFLHATQYGGGPNQKGNEGYVDDDTLIGEYRINFADRSALIIPIVYGQDVRDWFYVDNEGEPARGKVVWKGENDYAKSVEAKIRLYTYTWDNPWPEKVIDTIDYSSKKQETPAAPFCIAITLENPQPVTAAEKPKLDFYTVDHYDDARNPADDLKKTIERAKAEKKNILIQVGGDWCGWCKLMTNFIDTNEAVRNNLSANFLLMKVTWDENQRNEAFLSQYPKINGYPHLFVLDSDGKLLHSQDTSPLEEGHGYNEKVYLEFLDRWKPGAAADKN
jgi:thiol-disulfide isomerase/thioredoxin